MWRLLIIVLGTGLVGLVLALRAVGQQRLTAVAGLLTLIALAVTGDWYTQNVEMRDLIEATEASELILENFVAQKSDHQDDVNELIGRINAKRDTCDLLTGRRAANCSQQLTDAWGDWDSEAMALDADLATHAYSAIQDLLVAIDRLQKLSPAPWHTHLADARSSMLAHTAAWEEYLRDWAAVDGGLEASLPDVPPEIAATFRIADSDYSEAMPPMPLFDLETRAETIFAELAEATSGGAT